MKNRKNKLQKDKKLSLIHLDSEYMVLYKSKNKTYSKKFAFPFGISLKRIGHIFTIMFFLTMVLLFVPFDDTKKKDEPLDDEGKKDQILFSEDTNFSPEEKNIALEISTYTIKSGDSLSEIAKKYGVSMDTICGSNNLRSYDLIHVGTVLKIPNKDGILHKFKKGQKLITIANKYKIDIDKIIAANNFINADFISIGEEIFIPDAKPNNIMPGFLWPAMSRRVTCGYGSRIHPVYRVRRFHKGIDIKSNYQPVRATRYGKVTFAGWMGGYGKAVIVAHPGGWKSLYGHLSRIYVKRGQYIKQGQYLARSGNTGVSTGPHLHFELIKNGRHKNPFRYLKR